MNLDDLDHWLAQRNLGGHWNRAAPEGAMRPFLWKWSDIYQGLMWANDLVPMEKTGRRTITLKNPALKSGMTPTIHMSVQSVLPGEVATAHRHNFSAMRFILNGSPKAFTVVEGERIPMEKGDFLTTPNWTWHDHYNGSDEPVYWLDGLDVRLTGIGARLYEDYSRDQQPVERPANYTATILGHARPNWMKANASRKRRRSLRRNLAYLRPSGARGCNVPDLFLRHSTAEGRREDQDPSAQQQYDLLRISRNRRYAGGERKAGVERRRCFRHTCVVLASPQ
jgi:gentisate 1,2-dioxygenase